jgi:hypothetical protein
MVRPRLVGFIWVYGDHASSPACALRPDLAVLADGDMTEVGEKGGLYRPWDTLLSICL